MSVDTGRSEGAGWGGGAFNGGGLQLCRDAFWRRWSSWRLHILNVLMSLKGEAVFWRPEFWPGEFHGLHSPRGHKESDTTD